ncbi:hypothetical protein BB427_09525 [Pseudoalteromonas sp. BMB]|uniref:hypothetical protein n=1 Tax=Pseudoalteromonas sp. BMB TaxID=1874619 RepID=UPI00083D16BF|nr:hypothetical protein [Pseudoalteromonas sp. BMB]ODB41746.1 hypothetical protein BB427_09525 [Pseudoalteromonas sp. BMB]
MESNNKIKAFLDSLSFRDLTIAIEFLVTGYILYFYLGEITAATEQLRQDPSWVSGLLLKVIVISIVTSIAGQLLLSFVSDKDMDKPLDEREKLVALSGCKPAYWVLQVGVCISIFQYSAEAQNWSQALPFELPFTPLHILVIAFLLAELVGYGTQLVKARLGAVYG